MTLASRRSTRYVARAGRCYRLPERRQPSQWNREEVSKLEALLIGYGLALMLWAAMELSALTVGVI